MIQTAIRMHVSFDGHLHMPSVYCSSKRNKGYEAMKVLSGYCHSMDTPIKQTLGYCMWCDPKSYNKYYVHFCVPWILEVIANDPCAGTINYCFCCSYQLSILCRYMLHMHRPWFSVRSCRLLSLAITSVDGCCLYIIIHNCIFCGTWL